MRMPVDFRLVWSGSLIILAQRGERQGWVWLRRANSAPCNPWQHIDWFLVSCDHRAAVFNHYVAQVAPAVWCELLLTFLSSFHHLTFTLLPCD